MPQALVAADLHLALDVLLHLAAEVTFDLEVVVDPRPNAVHLFVREVTDAGVDVDADGLAQLLGDARTDAEDVREGDLEPLLPGDVDSCDSCHVVVTPAAACVVGSRR